MAKGRAAAAVGTGAHEIDEASSHKNGNGDGTQLVKTTLFITDALDANLAYMSLETGRSKAELVRKAVEAFLAQNEYDPRKKPKLSKPAYD